VYPQLLRTPVKDPHLLKSAAVGPHPGSIGLRPRCARIVAHVAGSWIVATGLLLLGWAVHSHFSVVSYEPGMHNKKNRVARSSCKSWIGCFMAKWGRGTNAAFGLLGSILLLGPVWAQEICPVEVKLLLSSPEPQPVIAALGFKKRTESRIYFFDTQSLSLLAQGAIIRIRQGAKNDLTVKLRSSKGESTHDNALLRSRFPCEIDRTRARADTSYAVERRYQMAKVPDIGPDVHSLLNSSQRELLVDAGVSIDWDRVVKVASIRSTKWQTGTKSPYGKLALELWEWSTGKVLELSSKAPSASDTSKYTELEDLLKKNGLSLNANQATKTTTVLESLANRSSPTP
jgi:hypothetical protein